jgi:hypothetical protein
MRQGSGSKESECENSSSGDTLIKQWIRDLDQKGAAYLSADKITFKELAAEYKEKRLIEAVIETAEDYEQVR